MEKLKSRDRLFAGVVLVIAGLLGLSSGAGMYGTMGGMMGPGYGYSSVSFLITLVFLGVTVLGTYLVYDAIKKE